MKRIGIVGARGFVGAELIGLLADHPGFELAYVSSRELAAQALADQVPAYTGTLRYQALAPEQLADMDADAVVLALPNGKAAQFVASIDQRTAERGTADPIIIDLSADYRFDDTWHYGLPELGRGQSVGRTRISNPGCYATAMQLAITPMRDVLEGAVQCFGVSGYSGAGTAPSDKNDPRCLRDNLMPYALAGHVHEREATRQLGHPVEFMPHVAPHFRGLTVTANLHLRQAVLLDDVVARYRDCYAGEPLVQVLEEAPWVSRTAGRHHAEIGGFTLSADGCRLVVVTTLDNLLKGAATQALQNLNLAFGYDELTGIPLAAATGKDAPLRRADPSP